MVKNISYRLCILVIAILTVQAISFSEDIRATAKVDSNNILIGDQLKLQIEVQHLQNISITFPALPDSFEGIEVIHREIPSTRKTDQAVLESATFIITAFDSGMHIVPPLTVYYTIAGDTTKRITETNPVTLYVRGIAIDTTQEIKDVKPPLSVPISFAEILPYLIGVVAVGAIVWLVYYIRKKRKLGESLLPEEPQRPANEIALGALRALDAERLWQRGKIKEYHTAVTDIVRIYIERRYRILAMEMTTDEILKSDIIDQLKLEVKQLLQGVLVKADFVKFAKFQPLPKENEESLAFAIAFVESTWAQETTQVTQPINEEVTA
jgi:hypothetical protein